MVDSERQRTYSTASYFPSPVLIAPNNDGTFLDDMSCRDPSFDIPRLTDKEVAEIIAEGPSIRARMERHKIDVEFVLECNSMLLEWVAMRERLLRQWHRVPAELITPPATANPTPKMQNPAQLPTPTATPTTPHTPGISRPRNSSLSSLPPLGALLQRPRTRSLRDRATDAFAKNQLVAGLTKRMKPRRKDCSCACTCGSTPLPESSLKFDDDAVVVIDLHAELIRYDELLRGLKERFDDRDGGEHENDDDNQDEEARYTPDSVSVAYDDAYEADEESITSPLTEQFQMHVATNPPNPRYPWRIAEAPEPDSENEDDEDDEDDDGGDTETEMDYGDASSIRTATPTPESSGHQSSVPPSPTTPSTFILDDHRLDTVSSGGTNHTLGVLSAAMQMEARSILGSECTGDTFGLRSYSTSAGDYGSVRSHPINVDSYRSNVSQGDQELSMLLDKIFLFDESVLHIDPLGVVETKEERERALGGAGRGVRLAADMRQRSVTEFGVRTRSFTAPIVTTPFHTPAMSGEGPLHPTVMTHSVSAMARLPTQAEAQAAECSRRSVALGGATIYTFTPKARGGDDSEATDFHPMDQFADVSTLASTQSSASCELREG